MLPYVGILDRLLDGVEVIGGAEGIEVDTAGTHKNKNPTTFELF